MKLGNMTVVTALSIASVAFATTGSLIGIAAGAVDPTKKLSDVKLLPEKKNGGEVNETK